MKFSTRTTYGIRALMAIAKTDSSKPLSIGQIADHEDLSPAYLERIIAKLKAAKIVSAVKGSAGGYNLLLEPKDVSVGQIINILEGQQGMFQCSKRATEKTCTANCSCDLDVALMAIEFEIQQKLNNISLANLLDYKK